MGTDRCFPIAHRIKVRFPHVARPPDPSGLVSHDVPTNPRGIGHRGPQAFCHLPSIMEP